MPSESKAQKKFFGVVRAVQKGKMPAKEAGKKARKAAGTMSVKSVRDFAVGSAAGLPQRAKKVGHLKKLRRPKTGRS